MSESSQSTQSQPIIINVFFDRSQYTTIQVASHATVQTVLRAVLKKRVKIENESALHTEYCLTWCGDLNILPDSITIGELQRIHKRDAQQQSQSQSQQQQCQHDHQHQHHHHHHQHQHGHSVSFAVAVRHRATTEARLAMMPAETKSSSSTTTSSSKSTSTSNQKSDNNGEQQRSSAPDDASAIAFADQLSLLALCATAPFLPSPSSNSSDSLSNETPCLESSDCVCLRCTVTRAAHTNNAVWFCELAARAAARRGNVRAITLLEQETVRRKDGSATSTGDGLWWAGVRSDALRQTADIAATAAAAAAVAAAATTSQSIAASSKGSVLSMSNARLTSLAPLLASPAQVVLLMHVTRLDLSHNDLRLLPEQALLDGLPRLRALDLRRNPMSLPPLRLVALSATLRHLWWNDSSSRLAIAVPRNSDDLCDLPLIKPRLAFALRDTSNGGETLALWWHADSEVLLATSDPNTHDLRMWTMQRFVAREQSVFACVGVAVAENDDSNNKPTLLSLWSVRDAADEAVTPILHAVKWSIAVAHVNEARQLLSIRADDSGMSTAMCMQLAAQCHAAAPLASGGVPIISVDGDAAVLLEVLGAGTPLDSEQLLLVSRADARSTRSALIADRLAFESEQCVFRCWQLCSGTRLALLPHAVALYSRGQIMMQLARCVARWVKLFPVIRFARDSIMLGDLVNTTNVELHLDFASGAGTLFVFAAGWYHEARLAFVLQRLLGDADLARLVDGASRLTPLCRKAVTECVLSNQFATNLLRSCSRDRDSGMCACEPPALRTEATLGTLWRSASAREDVAVVSLPAKHTAAAYVRAIVWRDSDDDGGARARQALRALCLQVMRGRQPLSVRNSFAMAVQFALPAATGDASLVWSVALERLADMRWCARVDGFGGSVPSCERVAVLEAAMLDELGRAYALVAEPPMFERVIAVAGAGKTDVTEMTPYGVALAAFTDQAVARSGALRGMVREIVLPEVRQMLQVQIDELLLSNFANSSGASSVVRFVGQHAVKRVQRNVGLEQQWWNEVRLGALCNDVRGDALRASSHLAMASIGAQQLYVITGLQRCDVGEWLTKHVDDGTPLTEGAPLRLLRDVASGLLALHAVGVAHNDAKVRNVLVGNNGHFMLADFGEATVLDATAALSWMHFAKDWDHFSSLCDDKLLHRCAAVRDRSTLADIARHFSRAALAARFAGQGAVNQLNIGGALANTPLASVVKQPPAAAAKRPSAVAQQSVSEPVRVQQGSFSGSLQQESETLMLLLLRRLDAQETALQQLQQGQQQMLATLAARCDAQDQLLRNLAAQQRDVVELLGTMADMLSRSRRSDGSSTKNTNTSK